MSAKKREWEARFLEVLAASCNVTLAAKGAGIVKQTVYAARQADPEFAARMDAAKEDALDILEAEAYRRAKRQSDTLMIFLLKAHKPEKYMDRSTLRIEGLNELLTAAERKGIAPSDLFNAMLVELQDVDADG